MSNLIGAAEAAATQVVLGSLIGVEPTVSRTSAGGYVVHYQGTSVPIAREKLNALMSSWMAKKPARADGVTFDLANVVYPVMLRQLWWVIALAGISGAFIYYQGRRSGRKGAGR